MRASLWLSGQWAASLWAKRAGANVTIMLRIYFVILPWGCFSVFIVIFFTYSLNR